MWSIMVDGKIVKNISEAPGAQPAQFTPEYFETLRIPIVRGPGFTEADRADAPMATIVNETMAWQLWPNQDPIGHTIKMFQETAPLATVVGVAKDIRPQNLQGAEPPTCSSRTHR